MELADLQNFINLVVPSAGVGMVTIDGVAVPPGSYQPIAGSDFRALRFLSTPEPIAWRDLSRSGRGSMGSTPPVTATDTRPVRVLRWSMPPPPSARTRP